MSCRWPDPHDLAQTIPVDAVTMSVVDVMKNCVLLTLPIFRADNDHVRHIVEAVVLVDRCPLAVPVLLASQHSGGVPWPRVDSARYHDVLRFRSFTEIGADEPVLWRPGHSVCTAPTEGGSA